MKQIDVDKLERLRESLNLTAFDFCNELNYNSGNYSKIINVSMGISKRLFNKIVQKYGEQDIYKTTYTSNTININETTVFYNEDKTVISALSRQLSEAERKLSEALKYIETIDPKMKAQ